jgi:hypothetical protein
MQKQPLKKYHFLLFKTVSIYAFTQSVFIVEKVVSNICGNFTFLVDGVGLGHQKGFE